MEDYKIIIYKSQENGEAGGFSNTVVCESKEHALSFLELFLTKETFCDIVDPSGGVIAVVTYDHMQQKCIKKYIEKPPVKKTLDLTNYDYGNARWIYEQFTRDLEVPTRQTIHFPIVGTGNR